MCLLKRGISNNVEQCVFFGAGKPLTCLYVTRFLLCLSVSGQDLVWQLHSAQAKPSEAKAEVVSKQYSLL